MSADYEIIGGLALLPIAAAILPVVGAGYAIYKGVQFAERQSETRGVKKKSDECKSRFIKGKTSRIMVLWLKCMILTRRFLISMI